MPNRTAKFVTTVFASLVAGAAFAPLSHAAPPAADDCLAGPKDHAPQGSHWYYRIEHPGNRHCWYLRGEQDKAAQAAAPNAAPSVKPVAPTADAAAMPRSVADARDELPAPQTSDPANSPPVPAADANTQPSLVASRWLDPASMGSSTGPATAAGQAGTGAPSNSAAAPSPTMAAVPLATAEALPDEAEKPYGSIRMVLLAIIGALSLAGLMGGAIFRFGGATWRSNRRGIGHDRRAIWDAVDLDRRPPPAHPGAHMREAELPRNARAADDPDRRIAEMLAQLSRRRAT